MELHWSEVLVQCPTSYQLLLLGISLFCRPYQISIHSLMIVLLPERSAVLLLTSCDIFLPVVVA